MDDLDTFLGIDPEPAEDRVSAAELADWLGLSSGRVNQMARDGLLPREADRDGYRFPLKASVRAYSEHTRANSRRVADPNLAVEKLRLTRAQADKAEQQAARDRGELLPVSEVRAGWTALMTELRAAFLAMPERVAATVGLDRAATAALDGEIRAVLTDLADRGEQDNANEAAEQGQEAREE